MSKINIEIDFNNLKYNLYELLDIHVSANSTEIKNQSVKVINNIYKNSDEEKYYHVILANQLLLNTETRKKYDDFINRPIETFEELKTSFSDSINDMYQHFPPKDISVHTFNIKINELNKKHGYDNITSPDELKRNIFNTNNKIEEFQEQIVFKGPPLESYSCVVGEEYTILGDLDKLYVNDSILSSKFTSLDKAFMIQPVIT
jgi:hypothetical protein